MKKSFNLQNSTVAVVGAAGHTGRFVVQELLHRSITPIAISRSSKPIPSEGRADSRVDYRHASLDNPALLDAALSGAQAVINCAGPFLVTGEAVAEAALRAGIHYLDVSAEQASTAALLDKYGKATKEAGIVFLPAMAFYGGLTDLLATSLLEGWEGADSIDVMLGLDSWHPTRGTRITGEKNIVPRVVIANGQLAPLRVPANQTSWDFAKPLGAQTMVEVPFSEIILISRHLKTLELHTYLSSVALADIRDASTPPPKAEDETGRSEQRFIVEIEARRGNVVRRISAQGRDIYGITAPLICEAASRLLKGEFGEAGALPPGAVFNAGDFLSALEPEHLTLDTSGASE